MQNSRIDIEEPSRRTPVIHEADVCVLGGSCTGLFAAVRAARLGAKVVLVERQNCFGGVATLSLVNIWHSLLDTNFEEQIIGGLTAEVIERLDQRGAGEHRPNNPNAGYIFNPEDLKITLDELAVESGIKLYLHTLFVAPWVEDGQLAGVLVENKSGRGLIRARQFVDATGDGDLVHRLGLDSHVSPLPQPSTTCAKFGNWAKPDGAALGKLVAEFREEFHLPHGFVWGCNVPDSALYMIAGTRVPGMDPTDADSLTAGEIEGRRQVGVLKKLIRKLPGGENVTLETLPARIGLRESRHIHSHHRLTTDEVLHGVSFPDVIAKGSYRVDIHHIDKPGITLRYLDGREEYSCPGQPKQYSRWREETETNPTHYQIPYRSLVPKGPYPNLIAAGRMIDTEPGAHAAVRVMVNMNQTGEAAGVACTLALQDNTPLNKLDPMKLRQTLSEGGSLLKK
ncbi:MAG: FAD-dependent oxidoreductase [Verrucomicrobia bacterium]|nr:FAD-dependent oxidoreductase [Verrucomicrobiota bacterium]MCH8514435.1 FAD-dependent oxidoreductase [Kiritimatiellia bacterium]